MTLPIYLPQVSPRHKHMVQLAILLARLGTGERQSLKLRSPGPPPQKP